MGCHFLLRGVFRTQRLNNLFQPPSSSASPLPSPLLPPSAFHPGAITWAEQGPLGGAAALTLGPLHFQRNTEKRSVQGLRPPPPPASLICLFPSSPRWLPPPSPEMSVQSGTYSPSPTADQLTGARHPEQSRPVSHGSIGKKWGLLATPQSRGKAPGHSHHDR